MFLKFYCGPWSEINVDYADTAVNTVCIANAAITSSATSLG